ncbi:H(+)/Cl(-) exchange transporter 6-like [Diadema antillarum]|uniref:H(+)/Cl(-) exchange transporter 6-like n=1 Tax=Diadema antillarum TaxID=105358 RepID=UPI003A86B743
MAGRPHKCCLASCVCCIPTRRRDGEELQDFLASNSHSQRQHLQLPRKDYDSLDYDTCYSEVYSEMLEGKKSWASRHLEVFRWIMTAAIGILTGLVAVFINYFVDLLSDWKLGTVDNFLQGCTVYSCIGLPLLVLMAFNASFVLIASLLVAMEPIAGGSGIPEIKCYLNGVKVPHVVRLKTLVSKAIGVLFSVAGGLFVGKEGPMIHSGAIVGAGIPQFQSITFRRLNFDFPYFRTDRDKRDFVSGGAAAGVAAAFGAPIGGVLFSLEEGSSFWNQALTWRTFFCAMCATFALNFLMSGINYNDWGGLSQPGLIDFGVFMCGEGKCNLWTAVDLLIFIAMGFVGGLLGALFNAINTFITICRLQNPIMRHKAARVAEAILVAVVTTLVAFLAAMTMGVCKELHHQNTTTQESITSSVRTYFCPEGYYNDMATLFFNPQEEAIKQLFHQEGTFSLQSLGLFFMYFFFLACWTYGAAVPSGLFVPSLLCGAAYGRFVGNVLHSLFPTRAIYTGSFALVGAAAFLGGVVRMTISLTVILIESTNEISYGLPIMVTLMVAKWSGDLFNQGLYDIHIKLRGVPLLEWEANRSIERLRAHDVMEPDLVYVYPHTRVLSLINILRTTTHHAFPVVTETAPRQKPRRPIDAVTSKNMMFKASTLTRAEERKLRGQSVLLNDAEASSLMSGSHTRPRLHSESVSHTLSHTASINGPVRDVETPPDSDEEVRDEDRPLTFHGLLMRDNLVTLLRHKACYPENLQGFSQPHVSYEKLVADYPRYPDIYDISCADIDGSMIMDVTKYMTPCPYTVYPDTPAPKVFNLFRTMGLRHLPVVNCLGEILGIITRHNLTEEFLEEKVEELHRRESSQERPSES